MAGAVLLAMSAGYVTKAKIESRRAAVAYYRQADGSCVAAQSLTSSNGAAFTTSGSGTSTTAKIVDESGNQQQLYANSNCTGNIYFNR